MSDKIDFSRSHGASSYTRDPGKKKLGLGREGARKNFTGVSGSETYHDYVIRDGRRQTAREMRSMNVHERHKLFMS